MQPELLSQLKIEIHNKCVAYDYSDAPDTTLSDFIINLLQAYKTAEEVNEELIALVGSDYDSNLTQWIFERKKELENTPTQNLNQQQQPQQVEQNQQEQKDENMDDVSKITKPNRESRIFSKAIGSVIGNVNRNGNSSQSRRNERSRSRSPKRYSSRSPKRYSSRSPKRYSSRSPARYSSRSPVRQSSRSPVRQASRSPVRHASRYEHDRHSSRHEDRRSNRYDNDRNNSSNIFSRLGHSNTNPEKEDGRPSVFDRLGGSKPITITQNNQDSKKERCKYWPNCKNGEQCIYFHPTTVCPDFPNCSKPTVECMFIHPEIPKPVMPQIKKLPVPCKFFPYCTNPLCPFVHPVAPQPFFMQPNPSFATTGQRVQIPCKNGDQCTRPDCHFLHPKDPNPKTDVICKFDGACTRPNCFYKHTKPTNPNKVFIKPDLNTRQFSVAEDEVVERIPVGDSADLITNQHESTATKTDDDVVMDTN